MKWTTDFVYDLATDQLSINAAEKFSNISHWIGLFRCHQVVWGEVQGSHSQTYYTQIDLDGPVFKCSCPSRKLPCKHGLGLGLILAKYHDQFQESLMPEWVISWIKKRQTKLSELNTTHQPLSQDPTDHDQYKRELAKSKRIQKRIQKVTAGLIDLQNRLQDLARHGLGSIEDPFTFWDEIGARLVDTQASGLAKRVRLIAQQNPTPTVVLKEIAYLNLVCEAWQRHMSLSISELEDLKTVIGFTISKDQLNSNEGIKDQWVCVGIQKEQEQHLSVLKQWLWGIESKQVLINLSYVVHQQPHPLTLTLGVHYYAEACLYPGNSTQRSLLKKPEQCPSVLLGLNDVLDLNQLRTHHAHFLGLNPWMRKRGYVINHVNICKDIHAQWYAQSTNGMSFRMEISDEKAWKILAITGGQSACYFMLWDSHTLTPLSLITETQVFSLEHRKVSDIAI